MMPLVVWEERRRRQGDTITWMGKDCEYDDEEEELLP